jgi:hypothetical protein
VWESNKKETTRENIYQWFDYRRKLTSQRPTGLYKVLYDESGTHVAACVMDATQRETLRAEGLPVNGFINDTKTYAYETANAGEAHYLCAILNSAFVDAAIKPYQTRGQWGERDIHRRPLEILPFPRYDPADTLHQQLADISKACHAKVAAFAPQMTKGKIGQQRQEVRRILSVELAKIDTLVRKLLGAAAPPSPAPKQRTGEGRLFDD